MRSPARGPRAALLVGVHLTPGAIELPAVVLQDVPVARVDAPQGQCKCVKHPSGQKTDRWTGNSEDCWRSCATCIAAFQYSRVPFKLLKLPWRSMARIASAGELPALRLTYSLPYWVYVSPSKLLQVAGEVLVLSTTSSRTTTILLVVGPSPASPANDRPGSLATSTSSSGQVQFWPIRDGSAVPSRHGELQVEPTHCWHWHY